MSCSLSKAGIWNLWLSHAHRYPAGKCYISLTFDTITICWQFILICLIFVPVCLREILHLDAFERLTPILVVVTYCLHLMVELWGQLVLNEKEQRLNPWPKIADGASSGGMELKASPAWFWFCFWSFLIQSETKRGGLLSAVISCFCSSHVRRRWELPSIDMTEAKKYACAWLGSTQDVSHVFEWKCWCVCYDFLSDRHEREYSQRSGSQRYHGQPKHSHTEVERVHQEKPRACPGAWRSETRDGHAAASVQEKEEDYYLG